MKVVVAHDYLTQRGGAERVVLTMLEALPGARLVTTVYSPDTTFPEFRQHRVETMWPDRVPAFRRDPRLALPVLAPAVSAFDVGTPDVLVASSAGWAHGLGGPGQRKLVYCYTPARWLHTHDYGDELGPGPRLALRALAPALRRWDVRAARSATRYLAISTVVQQRIRHAYGIDAELLYPPTNLDAAGPQEPLEGVEPGYLLTVARRRGYKNSHVVCEAVAGLPGERLVVVGGLPPGDWPDNVTGLVDLSDAQLRWVYAHASALVAVSREDFGLTPVEGYGFGVPSVLLRAGGYLDSSVEDLTTVFVDRAEPDAVRAGVRRLRAQTWDAAAIREHAVQFGPTTFQRRLQQLVKEVART